eukprot:7385313-Pyramimonas_sp.AAC.1
MDNPKFDGHPMLDLMDWIRRSRRSAARPPGLLAGPAPTISRAPGAAGVLLVAEAFLIGPARGRLVVAAGPASKTAHLSLT